MKRDFYLSDMRFVFYVFSKHRNLTKCAQELRVHPSTVSKAIDDCEALLKIKLVTKTGRFLVLTRHGEVFAKRIEEIIDNLRDFEENLSISATAVQSIIVSAHSSIMKSWLKSCLLPLIECYPQLRFTLRDQNDVRDSKIGRGHIYVGFGRHWMEHDSITLRHVGDVDIAVYAPVGGALDPNESYELEFALKSGCALQHTDRYLFVEDFNGSRYNIAEFKPYSKFESPSLDYLVEGAIRAKSVFIAAPSIVEASPASHDVFEVKLTSSLKPVSIDLLFHQTDKINVDFQNVIESICRSGRAYYLGLHQKANKI